jgi:hypothetical protein
LEIFCRLQFEDKSTLLLAYLAGEPSSDGLVNSTLSVMAFSRAVRVAPVLATSAFT